MGFEISAGRRSFYRDFFVLCKMGLGRERRVPLADVRCLATDYCCAWGIFVGGRRIAHDTLVASRNKSIYMQSLPDIGSRTEMFAFS